MDILFVESPAFSKKVGSFLNKDEQATLQSLLAVKPLSGKQSAANENILEIFFVRCYVSYAIGSNGKEVFLLDIAAVPTPVPTPTEKVELEEKIRKWLNWVLIVERACEFLEKHWPHDWPKPWDDF